MLVNEGTGNVERGNAEQGNGQQQRPEWTVFSNHGIVLFFVATNPDATLRQISDAIGITERQVGRIVRHLAEAGMIRVERLGRRNAYTFNPEARLRHPTFAHVPLGPIISAIASAPKPPARNPGRHRGAREKTSGLR